MIHSMAWTVCTFLFLLIAAVSTAQTTAAIGSELCPLPGERYAKCGAHGRCTYDQRLGELVLEYDPQRPHELRQRVVVHEHANYCKCTPGHWGLGCEHACPGPSAESCYGRHVQPLPTGSPDERCGQMFHRLEAAAGSSSTVPPLAPGNFSWAVPGTCKCQYPYLGAACDWKFDLERMPKPWPDRWTPDHEDLLLHRDNLQYVGTVGSAPAVLDVCGGGQPLDRTGCACRSGVFPTTLRHAPDLYRVAAAGGSAMETASFPVKGTYLWSPVYKPPTPTPWLFSQTPVCNLHAKSIASAPPPPPAVDPTPPPPPVVDPTPPPSPPPVAGDTSELRTQRRRRLIDELVDWQAHNDSARACFETLNALGPVSDATLEQCTAVAESLEKRELPGSNLLTSIRPLDVALFPATQPVNAAAVALGVIFGLVAVALLAFLAWSLSTSPFPHRYARLKNDDE